MVTKSTAGQDYTRTQGGYPEYSSTRLHKNTGWLPRIQQHKTTQEHRVVTKSTAAQDHTRTQGGYQEYSSTRLHKNTGWLPRVQQDKTTQEHRAVTQSRAGQDYTRTRGGYPEYSRTRLHKNTGPLPRVEQHGQAIPATAGLSHADGFNQDAVSSAAASLQTAVQQGLSKLGGVHSQQLAAPNKSSLRHCHITNTDSVKTELAMLQKPPRVII